MKLKSAMRSIGLMILSCIALACATSFTGSAHVEEGRSGCEMKCKGQGLEFSGMVYMGEYSDACVCSVPGQQSAASNAHAASAVAASSAGVMMQMAEQQRQQSQRN